MFLDPNFRGSFSINSGKTNYKNWQFFSKPLLRISFSLGWLVAWGGFTGLGGLTDKDGLVGLTGSGGWFDWFAGFCFCFCLYNRNHSFNFPLVPQKLTTAARTLLSKVNILVLTI